MRERYRDAGHIATVARSEKERVCLCEREGGSGGGLVRAEIGAKIMGAAGRSNGVGRRWLDYRVL